MKKDTEGIEELRVVSCEEAHTGKDTMKIVELYYDEDAECPSNHDL